jgi:hypothetical protein
VSASSGAHQRSPWPAHSRCRSVLIPFWTCAELANIKVRKEIDMEDYMRRYNMTPLVQTRDLDAGKKVLQRVRPLCQDVRGTLLSIKHMELLFSAGSVVQVMHEARRLHPL